MTKLHLGSVIVPDVTCPRPEDVDLAAIVDWLGRVRRFNHRPGALTILEHCRLVKALAVQGKAAPRVIQWAFRHDWHEAITGDIPAPVKRFIASDRLAQLERAWDEAICAFEGRLPPDDFVRIHVKHYDRLACRIEMTALGMTPDPDLPEVPTRYDVREAWAYALGREVVA